MIQIEVPLICRSCLFEIVQYSTVKSCPISLNPKNRKTQLVPSPRGLGLTLKSHGHRSSLWFFQKQGVQKREMCFKIFRLKGKFIKITTISPRESLTQNKCSSSNVILNLIYTICHIYKIFPIFIFFIHTVYGYSFDSSSRY